jgi:CMP-N,N'-diacetyllegionaminic acid synthase
MSLLMLIPARGGSKGILNKNLKEVHGKPLISYAIANALDAENIDKVVVSTDDETIASVAKEFGAEVPFIRPPELASDEVSLIPVAQHASQEMLALGFEHDQVASLQPTAPLLSGQSIDDAINLMKNSKCDSVGSISQIENHPYTAQKMISDGKITPLMPEKEHFLHRQDRPVLYSYTGGFYLRQRGLLENWSGLDRCMGNDRRGVIVNKYEALDINSPFDLELLDAYLRSIKKKIT